MVSLRDATPADALPIATVHVESWQVGYRGLVPDDVLAGLSVATREQWWYETLSAPGTRSTLLATEAGIVLGFAAIGAGRDGDPVVGELYAMYLRSTAWGRGVGTLLHAGAMARLGAFGFDRASLWMLAGNRRALRFYRREGWTSDGRSKLVTGPGGVELDHRGMSRRLARPVTVEPC
jgi:GNAT superfamily N-acetyltransferase